MVLFTFLIHVYVLIYIFKRHLISRNIIDLTAVTLSDESPFTTQIVSKQLHGDKQKIAELCKKIYFCCAFGKCLTLLMLYLLII